MLKQFSVANSSKSLWLLFFRALLVGGLLLESVAIFAEVWRIKSKLKEISRNILAMERSSCTCFLSIAKTFIRKWMKKMSLGIDKKDTRIKWTYKSDVKRNKQK